MHNELRLPRSRSPRSASLRTAASARRPRPLPPTPAPKKRSFRPLFTSLTVSVSLAALIPASFAANEPAPSPRPRPTAKERAQGFSDRALLAKPRAGGSRASLAAAEAREGLRVRRSFAALGELRVLEAATGEGVAETVSRLRATGRYEFVEPDYLRQADATPNDSRFVTGDQWALRNTGQAGGSPGADIRAPEAWDIQSSASSVIVAVVDSGISLQHEDLAANLWVNPAERSGATGRDDDSNGYLDDVNGINSTVAPTSNGSGNPLDPDGHGTAVASVIGAVGNNGRGMTGVAWNVQLMALRYLDDFGYGWVSDEVECIDYAIAKRARIINVSSGGPYYSASEFAALKRARDAGIIVVCSAGNDGRTDSTRNNYPAAYLLDNIVSVANTTRSDTLAVSSNYGSGTVDLGAPGTDILLCSRDASGYRTASGTSFSAPFVSGALALLTARFPGDNYRQSINRLLSTVDRLPALVGKATTGGRLNLAAALRSTSARPFNDDFAKRSTLSGTSLIARNAAQFGTREGGEPAHAGLSDGTTLWWEWTSARTATCSITTSGSSPGMVIAVYTGSSVNTLISVASHNGGSVSTVSFTATAGTTYQIAAAARTDSAGLVVLNLNLLSGIAPTIIRQPVALTVAPGARADLSVQANGSDPLAFQWRRNGLAVSGATTATLSLPNVQSSAAGVYTVVVSNAHGSVTSDGVTLTVISVPTISVQPASVAVAAGGQATLSVQAAGSTAVAYQWFRDGVAIPGATSAILALPNVDPMAAGPYTCVLTNPAGSITSAVATLTVNWTRLSNVAVRSFAGTGAQTLMVGFSIAGSGSKAMLLRGVGPALAGFGVSGVVADPELILFNSRSVEVYSNDNWGGDPVHVRAFSAVGAFPLPAASADAALLVPLPTGSYTAQIAARSGPGIAMVECYDSDAGYPSARLANVSVRAAVGTGANVLIVGLVISGNNPGTLKRLLVRGVGPTLGTFGVIGVLADPLLRLYNSRGILVTSNDNWLGSTTVSSAAASVAAFPLPASSRDAALVVSLAPGAYTAQLSGVNNTSGVALVEVYELP